LRQTTQAVPDEKPCSDEIKAVAKDHPQYFPAFGAKCHPYADFIGAAVDSVSKGSVEADRDQKSREAAEEDLIQF
jgi:hypothetical protein